MQHNQPKEEKTTNKTTDLIQIPITKKVVDIFHDEAIGPTMVRKSTAQILSFIQKHLPAHKINLSKAHYDWQMRYIVDETVKNIVDAKVLAGLNIGDTVEIKTIIQSKEGQVYIKIKDNGPGFNGQKKGDYFTQSKIIPVYKTICPNEETLLVYGGLRTGTDLAARSAKVLCGTLFFKNRKKQGAAVYISFAAPAKDPEPSTTSAPKP